MFKIGYIAACLSAFILPVQGEEDEIQLFNGKDFTGWEVLVGEESIPLEEQEIFSVKEGEIHVYPTQKGGSKQPFAGLVTKRSFENYHLKVDFKWGKKKFAPRANAVRDAGVLVHVMDANKIWPASVELQIQEGDTGDLWIIGAQAKSKIDGASFTYSPKGSLVTRPEDVSRPYSKVSRSYSWERPGWNMVELIVRGDHAIFKVNGRIVNEAIDCRKVEADGSVSPLVNGRILLQAEGSEVFYRNVVLLPLAE